MLISFIEVYPSGNANNKFFFYNNVTHQNFNKHFHFFPQPSLMSRTSLRAGYQLSIDFVIKMGNKTLQNRTYGGIWSDQLLGLIWRSKVCC